MRPGHWRKVATLLFLWLSTGYTWVSAQTKNEVLKTGFYKTMARGGRQVIDPQTRDTLYLDPVPVCIAADFRQVAQGFDDAGRPIIDIQLGRAGTAQFAKVSRENIGKKIAVIASGRLLSAPVVTSEISGGRLSISGNFTAAETAALVAKIKKELPTEIKKTVAEEEKETQLNQACNKLDSALIKTDTQVLKLLLHTQLSLGHSNGLIEDKNALLQHLTSGYLKYNSIEEQGYNEIRFTGDAAWIRRQLEVDGALEGTAFHIKLHVLEVWLWQEGRWKLWCRQSTKRL